MEFKLKSFNNVINVTRLANIHYFEFTNQYHTYRDTHRFCELVYVDSGRIMIDAENFSGELKSNCLIIHRAGEAHSLKCCQDEAPNVIIIGFECDSELLAPFSTAPVTLSGECVRLLTDIIKEGRNVFLPPYDVPNVRDMKKRKDAVFGSDQMLKLKLEAFLICLIRSTKPLEENRDNKAAGSMINEVYDYINRNFREKIDLSELCFLYCTNKTSLCNGFKKAYGVTIIQYINMLKLKETKKLLREGKNSLTEIATMLNMSSVHYLSRLFKKYENKTPSEYINTIKSKLEN